MGPLDVLNWEGTKWAKVDENISAQEAIEKLKQQQVPVDAATFVPHPPHQEADSILCEFLIKLGYGNVVDEYEKVEKWY
ncbi:MAG: hypothetical protein O3B41_11745 [Bacteroidetes bacterium]|nr:hypothetical protein [Bacteroidota bacterium]